MIRSAEFGIPSGELSLRDLEMVLPSLMPIGNTALLSDFDETMCSNYRYDASSKTHWPNIDGSILSEARRMQSPLFIVTSRSAKEPVVQRSVSSLVAHRSLPIICENGAVLFFPQSREEIVLTTDEQRQQLDEIRGHMSQLGSKFRNRELLIKNSRVSTIELRLQHMSGVGDPTLYGELVQMLLDRFDLTNLNLVSSSNSLSVQPKGINKGTAFLRALSSVGMDRNGLFIIGLGDAPNDKEIFEQADLGIAVRKGAKAHADLVVDEGDKTTLLIMQKIR